jgi:hypothetical protein
MIGTIYAGETQRTENKFRRGGIHDARRALGGDEGRACALPQVVWSRLDLAEFEQFEPECLDLGEDAVDGGPIREQPG